MTNLDSEEKKTYEINRYLISMTNSITPGELFNNPDFDKFCKFYEMPENKNPIKYTYIDFFLNEFDGDSTLLRRLFKNINSVINDKNNSLLPERIEMLKQVSNHINESLLNYISLTAVKGEFYHLNKDLDSLKEVEMHLNDSVKSHNEEAKDLYQQLETLKISQSEMEENLDNFSNNLKKSQSDLHELRDIKSKVYTDFIAILGIFSALIFSLFGGFNSLSSVLTSLANKQSLPHILISISLLGVVLICLIFCLLQFVATMSDRTISLDKKSSNPWKKYPVFSWSLTAFLIVLFLGVILAFNHL